MEVKTLQDKIELLEDHLNKNPNMQEANDDRWKKTRGERKIGLMRQQKEQNRHIEEYVKYEDKNLQGYE